MANPYYNNMHGANFPKKPGPPTGVSGGSQGMPEKTAAWPGVPGKTQSKDRGPGTKKCKCYPVSQGI